MINKFKDIISKIKVAQKKNKKILIIKYDILTEVSLNLLWRENLVYGYRKLINKKCVIFLKYSTKGLILLKRLVFFKFITSLKKLKLLNLLEKNYTYFLLNDKGFFSQKSSLYLGGYVFLKI